MSRRSQLCLQRPAAERRSRRHRHFIRPQVGGLISYHFLQRSLCFIIFDNEQYYHYMIDAKRTKRDAVDQKTYRHDTINRLYCMLCVITNCTILLFVHDIYYSI